MTLAAKLRMLITASLIAVIIWASLAYPQQILSHLEHWKSVADHHPVSTAVVFIGVYIAATVLVFLPVSFLTLIGGWLFGPVLGSCCNVIGALIGAALAFLAARYFATDWVLANMGDKLKTIRDGVSRAGWRFVALVRLAPVLPFNVLNCALGVTEIRFPEYLITTAIFMLPAKIAYTYVGSLGFTFITNPHQSGLIQLLITGGAAVAIVSLPWIIKYFKNR